MTIFLTSAPRGGGLWRLVPTTKPLLLSSPPATLSPSPFSTFVFPMAAAGPSFAVCRRCRTLRLYGDKPACKHCLEAKGFRYRVEDLTEAGACGACRRRACPSPSLPLPRAAQAAFALQQAGAAQAVGGCCCGGVSSRARHDFRDTDSEGRRLVSLPKTSWPPAPGLDLALVERTLVKHFGDIPAAARELPHPRSRSASADLGRAASSRRGA